MDINKGFKIDEPDVFVQWETDEQRLNELLSEAGLRKVTTGYYSVTCKSLGGLECNIGFHFEPRKHGRLKELEFFRANYDDQQKSFEDFQNHIEKEFGRPTRTEKGNEGFNNYEWIIDGIQILHFVFDRFGPEEHFRIKKI